MDEIVNLLSAKICSVTVTVTSEEHHPGYSPDQSDGRIKNGREIIAELRAMREKAEELHGRIAML